jgi:hypothetical protein
MAGERCRQLDVVARDGSQGIEEGNQHSVSSKFPVDRDITEAGCHLAAIIFQNSDLDPSSGCRRFQSDALSDIVFASTAVVTTSKPDVALCGEIEISIFLAFRSGSPYPGLLKLTSEIDACAGNAKINVCGKSPLPETHAELGLPSTVFDAPGPPDATLIVRGPSGRRLRPSKVRSFVGSFLRTV